MQFFKVISIVLFTFFCSVFSVQAQENAALSKVQVTTPFINMHTGPSIDLPVFYAAEKNEWLQVTSRRTGFFKVTTEDGTQGWVSEESINTTLDANGNKVVVSPTGIKAFIALFHESSAQ